VFFESEWAVSPEKACKRVGGGVKSLRKYIKLLVNPGHSLTIVFNSITTTRVRLKILVRQSNRHKKIEITIIRGTKEGRKSPKNDNNSNKFIPYSHLKCVG